MIKQLDDFDVEVRMAALRGLMEKASEAGDRLPPDWVNVHMHTFYSFNGENYSPAHIAWLAKQRGLAVAGMVDFDVLDGVEEFFDAARLLGIRACAGIETRVFVPEFANAVINSPGEPGIAYHMGAGIPQRKLDAPAETFLASLRDTSARRNRDLIARVNAFMVPVTLDYAEDVLPHTPNGNATERHICKAYAMKAAEHFPDAEALSAFWSGKLEAGVSLEDLPAQPKLLDRIRARTMKRGGVGYVQPDADSFPLMSAMNAFVLQAGGIPCVAWLDGQSEGEQRMEEWLDVAMGSGVAAINIIPDRNFTPGVKDVKLKHLQQVIALAGERDLPVLVGTEMNAPGQKFVDDFASAELAPFIPVFLKGARICYAHTLLQRHAGKGYLSEWAKARFPSRRQRNDFFARVGATIDPSQPDTIETVAADLS